MEKPHKLHPFREFYLNEGYLYECVPYIHLQASKSILATKMLTFQNIFNNYTINVDKVIIFVFIYLFQFQQ